MSEPLCLLTVHAHPDDEASKGAATVARYHDEGVRTVLVCCTGGEAGEILNPAMDRPEVVERLAEVRQEELARSAAAIGYDDVVMLGYRDSGMPGTPFNEDPRCFARADVEEAVGRLVAVIRRERPQVIITYPDEQTGYPHPDHIRVHDISLPAFDAAGDPDAFPGAGCVLERDAGCVPERDAGCVPERDAGCVPERGAGSSPWQPLKLYYSAWSQARMRATHEKFLELGLESPYNQEWMDRVGMDERITTKIDVSSHHDVRRQALLAHATQIDPTSRFWFGLPPEVVAYPYDDYILARSLVDAPAGAPVPEEDLFAGLRDPVRR